MNSMKSQGFFILIQNAARRNTCCVQAYIFFVARHLYKVVCDIYISFC